MRQYGELPPWLAPLNTPKISATTGLGTGGGAAVQTPDSGGFGSILLYIGQSPLATGNVVLTFPSAPPTLFVGCDFATLSQVVNGNNVTIGWAGVNFRPDLRKPLTISYEWMVSK